MIAIALFEGVHELSLYGVDMAKTDPTLNANGEYEHQRPSCEYMVGVATGMGVQVSIPEQSDLLKCERIYALESDWGAGVRKHRARAERLNEERVENSQTQAQLKEQLKSLRERECVLLGALGDNDYWQRQKL
jgi:hypothetical protein